MYFINRRLATGLLILALSLLLLPSLAPALEEEIRLAVRNDHNYDLLLEEARIGDLEPAEGFILEPDDIPYRTSTVVAWPGQYDVKLVWSVRYFTGLAVTLEYEAETGKMKARTKSNEFYPLVVGPQCEDGVCRYSLVIFNPQPWWGF